MSTQEYLRWARKAAQYKTAPVMLDTYLARAAHNDGLTAEEHDALCALGYGAKSTFCIVQRLSLMRRDYAQAQREALQLAVFLERPGQLDVLMASLDKHFTRGCPTGAAGPSGKVEWTKEPVVMVRDDTEAWRHVETAFEALLKALERHSAGEGKDTAKIVDALAGTKNETQWVREMTPDEKATAEAWQRTESVLSELRDALTAMERTVAR